MTPKERAAKAAARSIHDLYGLAVGIIAKGAAEAALSAIAEPSEAMIDAMCMIYDGDYLTRGEAFAIWCAAHAAMMAEKETVE